jgi:hypothetical protein
LGVDNGVTNAFAATFDLAAGTVSTMTSTASATAIARAIKPCGNGLYLCSVTGTLGGADTSARAGVCKSLTNGPSGLFAAYTGVATSSVYLWGAQLAQTAFVAPYIHTSGAAATRAADSLVMTPSAFAKYINVAGSTVIADAMVALSASGTYPRLVSLNIGGDTNNEIALVLGGSGKPYIAITKAGASVGYTTENNPVLSGVLFRADAAFDDSQASSSFNGGTVRTAVVGSALPVPTQCVIGGTAAGNLNGYVRQLDIVPAAVSDAQLKASSYLGAPLP